MASQDLERFSGPSSTFDIITNIFISLFYCKDIDRLPCSSNFICTFSNTSLEIALEMLHILYYQRLQKLCNSPQLPPSTTWIFIGSLWKYSCFGHRCTKLTLIKANSSRSLHVQLLQLPQKKSATWPLTFHNKPYMLWFLFLPIGLHLAPIFSRICPIYRFQARKFERGI